MAGICTAVQRRQRRATRRLGPGAATAERNEERMQRQSEAEAPVRNTQGPGTVFCFSLLHFITTVSTQIAVEQRNDAKTVTEGCRAGKAELCQQSDCPKAGGYRPAAEGGQPAAHKKVVEARWMQACLSCSAATADCSCSESGANEAWPMNGYCAVGLAGAVQRNGTEAKGSKGANQGRLGCSQ